MEEVKAPIMGRARAFSLLVMGRSLDSEEAKTVGIVNTVVVPGEVEACFTCKR